MDQEQTTVYNWHNHLQTSTSDRMYKTTPNEVTLTWNSSENIVTDVLQTWKPKENIAKTFMSQEEIIMDISKYLEWTGNGNVTH